MTEIESDLLCPIEDKQEEPVVIEPEPEPKTLEELLIDSLRDDSNKWSLSKNNHDIISHDNGTRLSYRYNCVSVLSDGGLTLDDTYQKTLCGLVEKIREDRYKAIEANSIQRAMARFGG